MLFRSQRRGLILHRQYFDPEVSRRLAFDRDVGDDMAGQPKFDRAEMRVQRAGQVFALVGRDAAWEQVAGADEIGAGPWPQRRGVEQRDRSEEHTSELQSLMRISYAVFCLQK